MEKMALMARLVCQGLLGIEVSQEKMELLEFKAYLAIKDRQVGKDRQGYLGIKDHQENKETRDYQDLKDRVAEKDQVGP